MDGFISRVVLCGACENPETYLVVSPRIPDILQICKACGYRDYLLITRKMTIVIQKNPPEVNNIKTKNIMSTTSRQISDSTKNNNCSSSGGDGDGDGGDNIDKREMENENLDKFYDILKQKFSSNQLNNNNVLVHKELLREAEKLNIIDKVPLLLVELCFAEKLTESLVVRYRLLFLRFTYNNVKAQRSVLEGLEQIIAINRETLLSKVSGIFKLFYDHDIVEENVFLTWGLRIGTKYITKDIALSIHEKAQPFLQWLQEADEESSSDTYVCSDENDSEIFDDTDHVVNHETTTTITTITTTTTTTTDNLSTNDDDDNDDENNA